MSFVFSLIILKHQFLKNYISVIYWFICCLKSIKIFIARQNLLRKITKIEYSCAVAEKNRQNLVMSMFCSNTLIFATQSWKYVLGAPDFNIFYQETCPRAHQELAPFALANGAYGASFLLFCLLQSFCHLLKTLLKPCFEVLLLKVSLSF